MIVFNSLIEVFGRMSARRGKARDASEAAIAAGPSWRYRRRLIHWGFFLAVTMIVVGMSGIFFPNQIAVELIIGGVTLLAIILTAYTASATYEDVRIWKPQEQELDNGNADGV